MTRKKGVNMIKNTKKTTKKIIKNDAEI